MSPNDPIVISDDDETASESERDPPPSRTHPTTTAKPTLTTASQPPTAAASSSNTASSSKDSTASTLPAPPQSFLVALDRAQMERDRRERNRKRRRAEGNASSSEDDKKTQNKAIKVSHSDGQATASSSSAASLPTTAPTGSRTESIRPDDRFWHGTVKVSYNEHAVAGLRGCTFDSLLLPATPSAARGLRSVVMSTYDLHIDWLQAHFPRDISATLIYDPPPINERSFARPVPSGLYPISRIPGSLDIPGWTWAVPRLPKGGPLTQHVKLLVLEHADFVRVAILSANLNAMDWETSENTAFIQDFPLRSVGARAEAPPTAGRPSTNDFEDQLGRVLRSFGVLPQSHPIWTTLARTDFSKAAARIVASWPQSGPLAGWDSMEVQGLSRLGKVVRDLGLPLEKGGVLIEAQGSSLATYNRKWLHQFELIASGIDPRGVLPLSTQDAKQALPPIKILFPTQRYVEEGSASGIAGGGTFFGKADTWAASEFKALYHQPRSRRGELLMHAKSLLAFLPSAQDVIDQAFRDGQTLKEGGSSAGSSTARSSGSAGGGSGGSSTAERPIGWTYLGSSNFTKAAHGTISGRQTAPTMSTSNWELGVVFPLYRSEVERSGADCLALRAITYRRPVEPYGPEDTPWDIMTLKRALVEAERRRRELQSGLAM
ncbi:uncharacterized protein PFL1_01058 [Pseudozyma flocculosa PF-1]|uniref:PLD phosphodiesterase domain-containing protein n=1 Tax=Pseudozyma flocculosa TaxID=84751 RepID=A0A5C3F8W3_9BASI|nr:uncharacterized protein PFL1_01058 [Pseudozyma flocculosa PF-1]EPQ31725.1 hypothetical protein PFL1_01058 [Pseudozyma flocculosa PF-1]SPO40842.1 uncharacterized protein PSFLO_06324 [Pseudozyma flocculosa]